MGVTVSATGGTRYNPWGSTSRKSLPMGCDRPRSSSNSSAAAHAATITRSISRCFTVVISNCVNCRAVHEGAFRGPGAGLERERVPPIGCDTHPVIEPPDRATRYGPTQHVGVVADDDEPRHRRTNDETHTTNVNVATWEKNTRHSTYWTAPLTVTANRFPNIQSLKRRAFTESPPYVRPAAGPSWRDPRGVCRAVRVRVSIVARVRSRHP